MKLPQEYFKIVDPIIYEAYYDLFHTVKIHNIESVNNDFRHKIANDLLKKFSLRITRGGADFI